MPVLGICYGEQAMAAQLGGTVVPGIIASSAAPRSRSLDQSALFDGVWEKGGSYPVWMSHGDAVTSCRRGFPVIAASENAPMAAIADEGRAIYGVQFHLEVVHTPDGAKLLANFVHKIAGLKPDWTMGAFPARRSPRSARQVGTGGCCAASRAASIRPSRRYSIHEAIGDQLTCVFVDHGLLRQGEAEEVVGLFRGHYNIPLRPRRSGRPVPRRA